MPSQTRTTGSWAAPELTERHQRKIQALQNEIVFWEILLDFWPFPNVESRLIRLEQELHKVMQTAPGLAAA